METPNNAGADTFHYGQALLHSEWERAVVIFEVYSAL